MATLADDRVTNGDDRHECTDHAQSSIQHFYQDTRVFITGGTGFMGQVLLEKLLRSCPGIERVYLLIRPKKGKDSRQRLDELFQGDLFSVLRSEQPKCQDKVTLITGDVAFEDLGLSSEDREVLVREVNVVFHVAATVKFDEKLRTAVDININGTKIILAIAQEMKNLKALVHVSTAYANCPTKYVHEKFYKPGADDVKLEGICKCLNDEQIDAILPSILGEWPNTYAFTKAVAEDCVRKYSQDLPIAIVRPSVVINTAFEPIKGWINNLYGPIGVTVGAAAGILKTLYCDKDVLADIIPVDLAINCFIGVAWDIERTKRLNHESVPASDRVPIYNYVSSNENPITWGQYMKDAEQGLEYPLLKGIWCYCLKLNKNKYVNYLYMLFLHLIPAILLDSVAWCLGKKPMLWNTYKKVHKFSDVIAHFTMHQWAFKTDNVQQLWRRLEPQDQKLFNFNIAAIVWKDVILDAMLGVRLHVFKETLDNLEEARLHYKKQQIAHYTLITLFGLLLLRLLYWFVCLCI